MNEEQALLLIKRVEELGKDNLDIHGELLNISKLLQEILETMKK